MPASRPWLKGTLFLLVLLLLTTGAPAQQEEAESPEKPPQVAILDTTPQTGVLRAAYYFQLTADRGIPPLKWTFVRGFLPPGVELDESTGVISGTPRELGDYTFTLQVTDSSQPPATAQREFTIHVSSAMSVAWKTPPEVQADKISGAVQVSNATSDDFDFTLIIVAVNEYGKAFALGYQHFTLNRETTGLNIDFASNVPAGQYVVHVDAVAEVPQRDAIFRARLQTPDALAVPLNP